MIASTRGMAQLDGGRFRMGDERFFPEEAPVVEREVNGFWIDEHPVTNAEFRRFVKATGHVTLAEVAPAREDFPNAAARELVPGSLVFVGTPGPVDLDDWSQWWAWTPGADWRHPEGPVVVPALPTGRPPRSRDPEHDEPSRLPLRHAPRSA